MESRLAIAEREAGLAAWTDTRLAAAKTPAEVENILADSTLEERLLNLEVGSYRWSMELQAAVMDSDIGISAFIKNAQELAGMAERFAASTKVASGHSKSLRTIAKKVSRQAHTISTQWCELFLALLSVADRIERETARGASQKQADET
jgi:hypothetical protein